MCTIIYLHFRSCNHYRAYTIIPCDNPFITGALVSVEAKNNPTVDDANGAEVTEENLNLVQSHEPGDLKTIVIDVEDCVRCESG